MIYSILGLSSQHIPPSLPLGKLILSHSIPSAVVAYADRIDVEFCKMSIILA